MSVLDTSVVDKVTEIVRSDGSPKTEEEIIQRINGALDFWSTEIPMRRPSWVNQVNEYGGVRWNVRAALLALIARGIVKKEEGTYVAVE